MTDFTLTLRSALCGLVLAGSLPLMAAEGNIALSVSDITAQDATVTVTPSSEDLTYYWNFLDKETFLANGGAEKAIENRIAVWERNASYYDNTTWQEMMNYELQQGTQTNSLNDYFGGVLMYSTDYVVYSFGMDREGNVIAPVSTAEFTTLTPPTSENTFEITITSIVKGGFYYTATAHVEPSNNDLYMLRFFTKEYVDRFDLTPGSSDEKRFISENMLDYLDKEEMANGPHDYTNTRCREGLEYYAIAMGLNEDKTPSTSLTKVAFTAVEDKLGTITLEVSDITASNAHIRIVPSDESIRYYYYLTDPANIERIGGPQNIAEKFVIDWWKFLAELYGDDYKWQDFIPLQTRVGTLDSTIAELVEEGELEPITWNSTWVLYAVGFDLEGNITTETATLEFTTPDIEKSDLQFQIRLVDAELDLIASTEKRKYYTVTVEVDPSNDDETYRTCCMQAKFYDQYLEDAEPDWIEFITRQFLPSSMEMKGLAHAKIPSVAATTALGDPIEYGVFVIGWNEGPTTDINVFRFNLTESGVESVTEESARVKVNDGTLSIEGLYDRGAVYTLDGRVAGALLPGHSVQLTSGIYVVTYTTTDGTKHTQKVVVK